MTSTHQGTRAWAEEAADHTLQGLKARGLSLQPSEVSVYEQTDALGEDAWRLVLILPAPQGETWDREAVFEARRAAIDIFDRLAFEAGRAMPGSTIATVTTHNAAPDEIAPAEAPQEGEDPGQQT